MWPFNKKIREPRLYNIKTGLVIIKTDTDTHEYPIEGRMSSWRSGGAVYQHSISVEYHFYELIEKWKNLDFVHVSDNKLIRRSDVKSIELTNVQDKYV